MKKYEKLYKEIIKNVNIDDFNKWIEARKRRGTGDTLKDFYMMFQGMRILTEMKREKYPNEFLPDMTKEETDYYDKLK